MEVFTAMTNGEFKRLIRDNDSVLSASEIEKILDAELEKNESEMDTELIEYCLDALNGEAESGSSTDNEKSSVKRRKIGLRGVIAAAVAAVMLVIGVISVSAGKTDTNLLDNSVEVYDGCVTIDFAKTDNEADGYSLLGTELAEILAENGIDKATFPEAFASQDFKILDVENEVNDGLFSVVVSYEYNGKSGRLTVHTDSTLRQKRLNYLNIKKITQIYANGMSVYIMKQGRSSLIVYRDGNISYNLTIPVAYDLAVQIAKTIK